VLVQGTAAARRTGMDGLTDRRQAEGARQASPRRGEGSLLRSSCGAALWAANEHGTRATRDSAAATDPARLAYGS